MLSIFFFFCALPKLASIPQKAEMNTSTTWCLAQVVWVWFSCETKWHGKNQKPSTIHISSSHSIYTFSSSQQTSPCKLIILFWFGLLADKWFKDESFLWRFTYNKSKSEVHVNVLLRWYKSVYSFLHDKAQKNPQTIAVAKVCDITGVIQKYTENILSVMEWHPLVQDDSASTKFKLSSGTMCHEGDGERWKRSFGIFRSSSSLGTESFVRTVSHLFQVWVHGF